MHQVPSSAERVTTPNPIVDGEGRDFKSHRQQGWLWHQVLSSASGVMVRGLRRIDVCRGYWEQGSILGERVLGEYRRERVLGILVVGWCLKTMKRVLGILCYASQHKSHKRMKW